MLKVSYNCFPRKIVSAVLSHRAQLACFDPISIVIIGSYLNSNISNQPPALGLAVKYLVTQHSETQGH